MNIWEIKPDLYQSSRIDDINVIEENKIDVVIDLEGWFDMNQLVGRVYSYLYWPIFDTPILPNEKRLWNVAGYGYRSWESGERVLVHCLAGHNRSGLVNGLILHLGGMKGGDAVKLIQSRVPDALNNSIFRSYLEDLEGEVKKWIYHQSLT